MVPDPGNHPPQKNQRTRKTIGLVACDVFAEIDRTIWQGAAAAAQERNLNLIYFAGGALQDPIVYRQQANVLYRMISPKRLDGLVVMTSSINYAATKEDMQAFLDQWGDIPRISLEEILPGIPCLVKDEYAGISQVMDHLIQVHQKSKIIFMRGPHGSNCAQQRFQAYKDGLRRYDLPYDPNLVLPEPESWYFEEALENMRKFLNDHALTPRYDFDAVIAVNDENAVAAARVLQERGAQVPGDISVTGFDDLAIAGSFSPALTTIRPSFEAMGYKSVEIMVDMLDGNETQSVIVMPTDLIIRHSCGCLLPTIGEAISLEPDFPIQARSNQSLSAYLSSVRMDIVREMAESVGYSPDTQRWATQLLNGFVGEIDHKSQGKFIQALHQVLNQVVASGARVKEWQRVISVMRRRMEPFLTENELARKSGNLWHQARVLVAEISWRHQSWKRLQSEERAHKLRLMGARLATELELNSLWDAIAEEIPLLGIHRGFLVTFQDGAKPMDGGELVVAFDQRRNLVNDGRKTPFAPMELLPGELWQSIGRYSFLVEALYTRNEPLGYLILDVVGWEGSSEGDIFDALQRQISTAIKAALLHREAQSVRQEAIKGWRLAEERRLEAEEANQLKSRFLSMVSHELRTPLNVISGLSENLIQDFLVLNPQMDPQKDTFYQDLTRIHNSSQHLDNLIRDVLDLAVSQTGQLRLIYESIDLQEALLPVIEIGDRLSKEKGIAWILDLPEELPEIFWDRTRLRQVLINLITNAVKFTEQGSVTFKVDVNQDPPSGNMVFSVCDTGLGIPAEDLGILFEEFTRTERVTARGYGGMGLGLAICRKLVELGGGEIHVDSSGEEGAGSCFYFSLPLPAQPIKEVPIESSPCVLLIHHGNGRSRVVVDHLEKQGYEIIQLPLDQSEDWVRTLADQSPGAIVLDAFPGSDNAWKLIDRIKDYPATRDIPILLFGIDEEGSKGDLLDLNFIEKPLRPDQVRQIIEEYGLMDSGSSKTILIVDDEINILEMHTRMVETQFPGSNVQRAVNGRAALDIMNKHVPDLVLLDLLMPELDGFQLLEKMKQLPSLRKVPVVVLTSQKLSTSEMQRLNQGVAAVLEKGIYTTGEMLDQLEAVLSRNKNLGGDTRRIARRAMAYIHENYGSTLSRKDLADHVGVSQSYFSTCFQKETGLTPSTYLERYRIKQAKYLLESSDLSVTEIAMQVGFCDASYFSRVFRRVVGISPLSFRRGEYPTVIGSEQKS